MKKQITLTTTVIIAVIIAVIGFFGGAAYGKHKVAQTPNALAGNFQGRQNGGTFNGMMRTGQSGMMRGGAVFGSVLKKDDKSITVQVQGGGSKLILLSGNTTVSKSATGTMNDVSAGSEVVVNGTANPDGSVTATSIQIRPAQNQ